MLVIEKNFSLWCMVEALCACARLVHSYGGLKECSDQKTCYVKRVLNNSLEYLAGCVFWFTHFSDELFRC